MLALIDYHYSAKAWNCLHVNRADVSEGSKWTNIDRVAESLELKQTLVNAAAAPSACARLCKDNDRAGNDGAPSPSLAGRLS